MRWVFFSSGLLKPPFLFSGFEAEIKFLWDSESKALESLAKPAEFQGIVKRIFLKWDGLWHFVSVQNVSKIISRKMLNMEIKQFYFLKPPSLQGRESFTANLLSLEKDFNEIEHTLSFSWFVKHQPANLQRIWIRFKSWAKTSSRKAHDKN